MKIFALSDFHLSFQVKKPMNVFGKNWDGYTDQITKHWNKKVKKNSVGIIAGDISWAMKLKETEKDFEYIGKLNGTKIIIKGNHDYWWSTISKVREALPKNTHALQYDAMKVKNIIFCGTRGWKLPEQGRSLEEADQKITDSEIARLELALQSAKNLVTKKRDKIVAILHYPPFNSRRNSSAFTNLLEKYGVKAVVYGHLHGKNCRAEKLVIKNKIKYYLTSCDLNNFKPVRVKL